MKIVRITPDCPLAQTRRSVTALGFFDGVHLGHIRLFSAVTEAANRLSADAAVFTFADDVRTFKPNAARLTCFAEKLSRMEAAGIRTVYVADFPTLASLSPAEFVDGILTRACGTVLAVCGFNFRFGRGAAGDSAALTALMRRSGGDATVIPPAHLGEQIISASAIRQALTEGDPVTAAGMLGRHFSLTAPILHGRGFGHTEGIPTVNQAFPHETVIPRYGVYTARAWLGDERWQAVTNVGVRPTFGDGGDILAETYLLGYRGEPLYGKTLKIEFLHFLRPEQRFASPNELYEQIRRDVMAAEKEDTE